LFNVALGTYFENSYERALDRGRGEPMRRVIERYARYFVFMRLKHARALGGALFGKTYVGTLHET